MLSFYFQVIHIFRRIMRKYLPLFFIVVLAVNLSAQTGSSAYELAQKTLQAHGGEKLSALKNVIIRGAADVSVPGSTQTLPVGFSIIVSGEKYRFEIQSSMFTFKQTSDANTSSIAGVNLPPVSREDYLFWQELAKKDLLLVLCLRNSLRKRI